ncbi:MAG: ureidoglycolate lyase [Rhodospirillales bacterium]|nr:ureidoglycolate lyase [Rhodospirillales bacterium]MBO6787323.1 ureidoglycolate lyase [Rhodospirillales bacterium]
MSNAPVENPETIGVIDIPIVRATPENLEGLGVMISDPDEIAVEIVCWPQPGWRTIDPGTGDEGGTTEGLFEFWWEHNVLHARNNAVDDQYVMAADARYPQAFDPDIAKALADADEYRGAALLFHANYHPDGGQLFFPQDTAPFVVPLAPPVGDDVKPEDFTAYWFDGTQGLYIHPNVWHETMLPTLKRTTFFDRQGKVHARISVDFPGEFGAYLRCPMKLED